MKVKIGPERILIYLFTLFSTSTLLYRFTENSVHSNRILGILIFVFALVLFSEKHDRKGLVILSLSVISIAIGFIEPVLLSQHVSDAFYFILTLLLLLDLRSSRNLAKFYTVIKSCKRFINAIVIINDIILMAGLFISSCWAGNWGGRYYVGFAFSPHVLCCGACLTLCLTLCGIDEWKSLVVRFALIMPASLAILESGSRTYLIALLIIWFYFYKYNVKKITIKLVIFPLAAIVGAYAILHSGIMEKFLDPNAYVTDIDIMEKMTNGRSVFWLIDLQAYWELNIINKLFGRGFGYVYFINATRYNYQIWAHNDFIHVIVSTGFVGIMSYLLMIRDYYCSMKERKGAINGLLLLMYFVITAFFSGVIFYQHYLYSFFFLYIFVWGNETTVRLIKKNKVDRVSIIYSYIGKGR